MSVRKKNDIDLKLIRNIFKFLEEKFDCTITRVEHEFYGTCVTYQNATTFVEASIEPREGGAFVRVGWLIDGKIPAYPIHVEPDIKLDAFYLDDIIDLRAPSSKIEQPPLDVFFKPRDLKKIERVLTENARALRRYAADILNGDFRVFAQLDKIVKKRAARLRKQEAQRRAKLVLASRPSDVP